MRTARAHTVVSGDEGALQRVLRVAEARGARRAVRLPISIASHSPLMESAQEQFRKTVQAMPWRDPLVPVVGNVSASVLETKEAIRVELSDALCRPVRWADSVTAMVNRGAVLFVEAGPGDVLSQTRPAHLALCVDLPPLGRGGGPGRSRLPHDGRHPQVTGAAW